MLNMNIVCTVQFSEATGYLNVLNLTGYLVLLRGLVS